MGNDFLIGMIEIMDFFLWLPINEPIMYIQSPNHSIIIRTDIKTGKRIIRKQQWSHIIFLEHNRWQSLKRFIFGNNLKRIKTLYWSTSRQSMILR